MGKKGCGGRVEKQAEQWELRAESLRTKARGGRGGVRAWPMAMSSTALISMFRLLIKADIWAYVPLI